MKSMHKIVKVSRKDWHKYLAEYDYEKLSLGWKKRLKSSTYLKIHSGVLKTVEVMVTVSFYVLKKRCAIFIK